ncbi:MAG TPA: B-box zinc finger protein [Bryobacteraceae bacterium]|nr:B-box zinc finger protein [Bryobacteraceae bacterium]
MNCYLHPETPAIAFCRTCGRSLCAQCQRPAEGTIYCQDHVPVPAYTAASPGADTGPNPYAQAGAAIPVGHVVRTSPGLAFILGIIPGVGAIYNGQYLKGLVHALITGLLITIIDNTPGASQPLSAMLLAAFFFYMPFEAYHTAKKREMGLQPDEWSSILPRSQQSGRTPIGPIILISIGVLYLLDTLNVFEFRQIARFWPVILILVGAYMLYSRVTPRSETRDTADPDPFPGAPGTPGSNFMGSRHD